MIRMGTPPSINLLTRITWLFRRIIHYFLQRISLFTNRFCVPDPSTMCELWRGYGAKIAMNVHIDPTCLIDKSFADLLSIEEHVVVAMGSAFILHDSSVNNVLGGPLKLGRIIVKRNAYIGAYSVILSGVVIGESSIVGAGSLVTKDVQPGAVVLGRPAKFLCNVEELALRFREKANEVNDMNAFIDFPSQMEKAGLTPEDIKAWGNLSKARTAQWLSNFKNE